MDPAHQEGIKEVGERAICNSNIASICTSGCNATCKRAITVHLYSVKLVIHRPKNFKVSLCYQDKIDDPMPKDPQDVW